MKIGSKILITLFSGAVVAHVFWLACLSRKMQGRVPVCQVQVHTLRSYIEEYRRKKGVLPKDLLKDLPTVITPWELASKSLISPFDSTGGTPRVSNVFDGTGGWFYDPTSGHIYPNYRSIRVWVSPFWFHTEDPTTWSQDPLK